MSEGDSGCQSYLYKSKLQTEKQGRVTESTAWTVTGASVCCEHCTADHVTVTVYAAPPPPPPLCYLLSSVGSGLTVPWLHHCQGTVIPPLSHNLSLR